MMKRVFILLWLCAFCAAAEDLNQAYQDGKATANAHAHDPIALLKALDVTQLPGYEANIPQKNYYNGVTQKGTALEAEAESAMSHNEAGAAIAHGFTHRSDETINPDSETFKRLDAIAENGDAIMHGQNTQKTTCSLKPKTCEYSWQEKTCLASKKPSTVSCTRRLHIDLVSYKTESYSLYLRRGNRNKPYKMSVDLAKPDTCKQTQACYTIYKDAVPAEAIVLPQNCAMVKVSIVDDKGQVLVEKQASCASPITTLAVGKCLFAYCNIPYFQSVSMTVEIYQGKESWDDHCSHLQHQEKEGLCHIKEALHCIEPQETRVIGDLPYTRACWKEKAAFNCGGNAVNTCSGLIEQGCEQTNSACVKEEQGQCTIHQKTYQCPLNKCTDNQLICGEDAFCLDGDCSSQDYAPGNEEAFKKAMSVLSATAEGSKDFDGKANFVFKGQMMECSQVMFGIKNCCAEKGWGLDMGLFHCKDSEKQLGKARENTLTVPTGKYCKERERFPGGSYCVDWHETYCVFQSKLARMVQVQGRKNQLGVSFGQGKHSNCSGLTPQQMQMIKFEDIDFSEFYQDIQNKQKTPDYPSTAREISKRVKDFYDKDDANG